MSVQNNSLRKAIKEKEKQNKQLCSDYNIAILFKLYEDSVDDDGLIYHRHTKENIKLYMGIMLSVVSIILLKVYL